MKETLSDLAAICEDERQVAICRELTKKFEETLVVPLASASAPGYREQWQGEFTLVVERSSGRAPNDEEEEFDVEARAIKLLRQGTSVKDTSNLLAKELSRRGEKTSRRELYSRVLSLHEQEQAAQDEDADPENGEDEPD
jgi:16S rRNA (cytidine1402-2'-O)-methyltransferase